MKTTLAVMVALMVITKSDISLADRPDYNKLSLVSGLGIGSNLRGNVSFSITSRLQYPKYTPLALEMFLLMPYGIGADIQITGFTSGRFTARFIDLGVFAGRDPVNSWVAYNWSIVVGSGVEYRFPSPFDRQSINFVSCSLIYRVFLPEPSSVLTRYGDFGKSIYLNALRGGQIIFGVHAAF